MLVTAKVELPGPGSREDGRVLCYADATLDGRIEVRGVKLLRLGSLIKLQFPERKLKFPCPACGRRVPYDVAFCPLCGADVRREGFDRRGNHVPLVLLTDFRDVIAVQSVVMAEYERILNQSE